MNIYLRSNLVVLVPPTETQYLKFLVHDLAVMNLVKWALATITVALSPFLGFWTLIILLPAVFFFCKANRLARKIEDSVNNNNKIEEVRFMKVAG